MSTIRHLTNAPIREAVIDIRTNVAKKIVKEDILEIKDHFNTEFTTFREIVTFDGKISLGEKAGHPVVEGSTRALLGYRMDSSDDKHILQIRNNGFTFSRLAPYTSWEHVQSTAQEYWKWFNSFRKIDNISRLAVRYINRIVLPFPVSDLSAFFTAPLSLPEGVPRSIENFFTKVSVRYADKHIVANIVHALDKADEKTGTHVILDIDAFSSKTNFDQSEVWPFLGELRVIKNQIFFGSLKGETLELYK